MEILFVKAESAGNDFVIVDAKDIPQGLDLSAAALDICRPKLAIGADGLLVYDVSQKADFKMRIFNPDGGEVEMCGNGARCIALYAYKRKKAKNKMSIETKAGIIETEINNALPKLKLTDPIDMRLDFNLNLKDKELNVNFVNTGVPHVVCFVEGLDNLEVENIGRSIRYHEEFAPNGTNANFVEVQDERNLKIRTYERGVEKETLACGTGAAASAIIASKLKQVKSSVNVHTASGETLKIYFEIDGDKYKDVCLEGVCRLVYEGKYFIKERRDLYV